MDSSRGTPTIGVFSKTSAPSDISNTTLLTTCSGDTETINGEDHSMQPVEATDNSSPHLVNPEGACWAELAELGLGA